MTSATLERLAIALLALQLLCVREATAVAGADVPRDPGQAQEDAGASADLGKCGDTVVWPRAKSTPPPKFPRDARRRGLQGTVVIRTTIQVDGKLGDFEVLRADHPEFVKPALKAVRKWTFEPATCNGRPVEASYTLRVNFELPGH